MSFPTFTSQLFLELTRYAPEIEDWIAKAIEERLQFPHDLDRDELFELAAEIHRSSPHQKAMIETLLLARIAQMQGLIPAVPEEPFDIDDALTRIHLIEGQNPLDEAFTTGNRPYSPHADAAKAVAKDSLADNLICKAIVLRMLVAAWRH